MVLIGILGNKRNGKDTTADFIVKNYNYNKYSFAKPLKMYVKFYLILMIINYMVIKKK